MFVLLFLAKLFQVKVEVRALARPGRAHQHARASNKGNCFKGQTLARQCRASQHSRASGHEKSAHCPSFDRFSSTRSSSYRSSSSFVRDRLNRTTGKNVYGKKSYKANPTLSVKIFEEPSS
ncbi:hypothetical protein JCGZ_06745 [Jatropha curcas]|uniref:Secreted protein n=1 Tax=Jatropha curcas TaxID=180498 RepID=A0A067KM39_JATCU|nr:hypothetical protein JCGZ_06745 [Jatropha curcas]